MRTVLALAVAATTGVTGQWRTVETQSPLLAPRQTHVLSYELPHPVEAVRVTLRGRGTARVGLAAAVSCGVWTRTVRARLEGRPVVRTIRVPRAAAAEGRCDLLLVLTNPAGRAIRLELVAAVR